MGDYHVQAGYNSVGAFVYDISISTKNHLKAFVNFIKSNTKLLSVLRRKDWPKVALYYNGAGYKKNNYDKVLENNYNALSSSK